MDLEKSKAFYQKLGLEIIVDAPPHYACFVCPVGSTTFSLHLVGQLPEGDGIHLYFEYDHLDNEIKKLQEKGMVFDELPNDKPWLWREARLKDPDGNRLILYHAGENRLNPPWRVKPKT